MGMNDVEIRPGAQRALLQHDERRIPVEDPRVQAQGLRTDRVKTRRGVGVAAGEERHVVAHADKLFRDIGHDALRSAVELRRHALPQRGDLCDSHSRSLSSKVVVGAAWS
jgi:hypothetical protein